MENIQTDEKIGEWLVRVGVMELTDVDSVLQEQNSGNDSLFGIIAMERGYIDPEILLTFAEMKGL